MPTLAKRMWLIAREESLRWREDGKIEAVGLKGADAIDVGNYKPSEHGAYAMFAVAAAEYGHTPPLRLQCRLTETVLQMGRSKCSAGPRVPWLGRLRERLSHHGR